MIMCPKCGKEMRNGYLFSSKDGAFSFVNEVPSALENAKNTEGFVKLTGLKVGGRTSVKACRCDVCKMILISYVNEKGSLIRIMPYYNYFEALAMLGCLGACNNLRIAKEYDPSSYCKAHKEVNDLGYSTWGIYTHYQIHAKALAVSIGVTTPPEVHGSGKYGHYNDKAHSLHIWFGGILNY